MNRLSRNLAEDENVVPAPVSEAFSVAGFTFKGWTKYDGQAAHVVTLETDAVTLDEALEAFEQFLKGMGFVYKGTLGVINEEIED